MNIYCIYPEWNLFIVGEGEERDKLEKFINENNIKMFIYQVRLKM